MTFEQKKHGNHFHVFFAAKIMKYPIKDASISHKKTLQPVHFVQHLFTQNKCSTFSRKSDHLKNPQNTYGQLDECQLPKGLLRHGRCQLISLFNSASKEDLRKWSLTTSIADIPLVEEKSSIVVVYIFTPLTCSVWYFRTWKIWKVPKVSSFVSSRSWVPGSQWVEEANLRLQGSCCRAHCSCPRSR